MRDEMKLELLIDWIHVEDTFRFHPQARSFIIVNFGTLPQMD